MSKQFLDDSYIYTGNHPNGDDIDSQGWKDLLAELGLDPDQRDNDAAMRDYVEVSAIAELAEIGQSVTVKSRKVTLVKKGRGKSNPPFGHWVNRTYQID